MSESDIKRRIQKERKLTASEAEAVLELATRKQSEAEGMGHLSGDDVREGAAEVGIDPSYVDEAMRELERERKIAPMRAARRRRRLVAVAIAALLVVLGGIGVTRANLGNHLDDAERAEAQLSNVLARRRALIPELVAIARASTLSGSDRVDALEALAGAPASDELGARLATDAEIATRVAELHRDLARVSEGAQAQLLTRLADEMAGAQNRITFEQKRYDEAVIAYNSAARGLLSSIFRPFTGMPAELHRVSR